MSDTSPANNRAPAPGTTRYRTFLRNPERNLGVFFRIVTATVRGDEIRFDNADGEQLAVARARDSGARFSMVFPRFDAMLDFTRGSREDAPGFYPRRVAELPVEEYFHGHHRDMTHDSRSAGKSLTSALLGVAIRKGALSSLDEPVYALLAGWARLRIPTRARKR